MLVRFSSTKTDPIIMFGDHAVQLIKMLGATGNVPGALNAADIPAALQRLRQHLQVLPTANPTPAKDADEQDDEQREPPIELATRAAPLIELLERAAAGNAPVMWEPA